MSTARRLKFDEIGYWSEVKLEIVRAYAQAYSTILSRQQGLTHIYIDGFAGSGVHISASTGKYIAGSPLNALNVAPPFHEYHLIDLDSGKAAELRRLTADHSDVYVYEGDCNEILIDRVLPRARYEDYRRALCLLDPYGLHLEWRVVQTAGTMKTVDLFINFPVMDMNMNVLWHEPESVDMKQLARMDGFWGDRSWQEAAYTTTWNLFGFLEKTDNEVVAQAYGRRLKRVAGFAYVPEPIPMRNSRGAIVYYLFFASQKPVAAKIVKDIFKKFRNRGAS